MSTQQDAADGEWEEITPSFEMTESSELEPVAVAAALQRLGAELARDERVAPLRPAATLDPEQAERARLEALHAENSRLAYANEQLAEENRELRRRRREQSAGEMEAAAANAARLARAERAVDEFEGFTGCADRELARAVLAAHGGDLRAAVEQFYRDRDAAHGHDARGGGAALGGEPEGDDEPSGRPHPALLAAGVVLAGVAAVGLTAVALATPEVAIAGGATAARVGGAAGAAKIAKVAAIATAAGAVVFKAVQGANEHLRQ